RSRARRASGRRGRRAREASRLARPRATPRAPPTRSPIRADRVPVRAWRQHRRSTAFETSGTAPRLARVNVLLVGSGGREHALAWRLAASSALGQLHAAPGNPGIAELGDCHPVRAEDVEGLVELARALDADLVVVGPEAP